MAEPPFGILFDYNGVIVDDEHLQEKAMADIVARSGVTLTHELYKEHCFGRSDMLGFENLRRAFPEALGKARMIDLVGQKTIQYARLLAQDSIVYPGLKETLQALAETCRMAIVTGSLNAEVLPVLEQSGLAPFFDRVITADVITRSKPHPEGYLTGVESLQLPPERVVVVEDSPHGIRAGKAAGLKCIAVLHSTTPDRLGEADVIVESVNEVTPELLQKTLLWQAGLSKEAEFNHLLRK